MYIENYGLWLASVAIVCMTYEPNVTETQHVKNAGDMQGDPFRAYVLSWLPDQHFEECDGEIGQDEDEVSLFCRTIFD